MVLAGASKCQRCLTDWKETFPMGIFRLMLITLSLALFIVCGGGGAMATAPTNPLEMFMPIAGLLSAREI